MANNWKKSIYLSAVLFAVLLPYCVSYFGGFSAKSFLAAIAGTGGFTLGVSFGLISAVRYLNVPREWIKYRREIGIVGYLYALLYTLAALVIAPDQYFDDFPTRLLTLPSLLGISSMAVMSVMLLISNNAARVLMGFKRWKCVMRFGYVAYAALVVRAAMLEGTDWLAWFENPNGLPPPRLVLSVFATIVVFARVLLVFSASTVPLAVKN